MTTTLENVPPPSSRPPRRRSPPPSPSSSPRRRRAPPAAPPAAPLPWCCASSSSSRARSARRSLDAFRSVEALTSMGLRLPASALQPSIPSNEYPKEFRVDVRHVHAPGANVLPSSKNCVVSRGNPRRGTVISWTRTYFPILASCTCDVRHVPQEILFFWYSLSRRPGAVPLQNSSSSAFSAHLPGAFLSESSGPSSFL